MRAFTQHLIGQLAPTPRLRSERFPRFQRLRHLQRLLAKVIAKRAAPKGAKGAKGGPRPQRKLGRIGACSLSSRSFRATLRRRLPGFFRTLRLPRTGPLGPGAKVAAILFRPRALGLRRGQRVPQLRPLTAVGGRPCTPIRLWLPRLRAQPRPATVSSHLLTRLLAQRSHLAISQRKGPRKAALSRQARLVRALKGALCRR